MDYLPFIAMMIPVSLSCFNVIKIYFDLFLKVNDALDVRKQDVNELNTNVQRYVYVILLHLIIRGEMNH